MKIKLLTSVCLLLSTTMFTNITNAKSLNPCKDIEDMVEQAVELEAPEPIVNKYITWMHDCWKANGHSPNIRVTSPTPNN